MYPLFETIRVENGSLCHPEWHQLRVNRSFKSYFGKGSPPMLTDCIHVPENASEGIQRCRFRYNASGFDVSFTKYEKRIIRSLRLVEANEIDYSLKYTDRRQIKSLLERKGNCDDILIVKNGRLTDTSYTNVAFSDGKNWFTPARPLLRGTHRDRLIHEGLLIEKDICPDDLGDYSICRLINAMLVFDSTCDLQVDGINW